MITINNILNRIKTELKTGKKLSKLFCEIQNWTFLKCPFLDSQNIFENKKKKLIF